MKKIEVIQKLQLQYQNIFSFYLSLCQPPHENHDIPTNDYNYFLNHILTFVLTYAWNFSSWKKKNVIFGIKNDHK